MTIINVHERTLDASPAAVGSLIDRLAGERDELWPWRWWPPMRFDRPLGPGAHGGHGPIRYTVSEHVAGERVLFTFTGPRGLNGEHGFELLRAAGQPPILRHTFKGSVAGLMRVGWALIFGPLHDALLEDALHSAERSLRGERPQPLAWSLYVRALRALLARRGGKRKRVPETPPQQNGRNGRPMAKAYWINTFRSVSDPQKLARYIELAGPVMRESGGRFLARGQPARVFEAGVNERTVVIEFDSVEQAVAAYQSRGYQEALHALGDGAERDLRIIEAAS